MNTTKASATAQWHLRIVGAWLALKNKEHCVQRINAFLTNLFALKCDNCDDKIPCPSPLYLASYAYTVKDPAIPCTRNLYITLGLTNAEIEAGHSLDRAAERFCRGMLAPAAVDVINMLTPMGIMGISIESNPFSLSWTRECYRECLTRGSVFVEMIRKNANDGFLPDWYDNCTGRADFIGAFMVCFVVVSGFDFGVFADLALPPVNVLGTLGPHDVEVASKVLEKYSQKMGYANELRAWAQCHQQFKNAIQKVLVQLEVTINPWDPSPAQTYATLCTALHSATVSLAKLLVFRHGVFTNFLTRCTDAANRKLKTIPSKDTSSPLEHIPTVTNMVTLNPQPNPQPPSIPLPPPVPAASGIALTISIPTIIAFTAAGVFIGGPILAAIAGLATTGYFVSEQKKGTSNNSEHDYSAIAEWHRMGAGSNYPDDMYKIMAQAWGVAYDALFLQRLLKRSQGGSVEFVDGVASSWWEKFTTVTRGAEGGPPLKDDLEAKAVVAYVGVGMQQVREVYEKKVEKIWQGGGR